MEGFMQGALCTGVSMSTLSISPHLRLDEEQARAVFAKVNCVVTAGAGAGKTTTLAARYVHLVMDKKIPVERILALTFTRKAAAEMYGRIYGELSKLASSEMADSWASAQLANFSNAQITTLDAFCARIVREAARDFGYTPDFSIDEEQVSDLVQTLARDFVRENAQQAGLLELLLAHPLDSVADDLFADVAQRYVTPQALLTKQFEPMKANMRLLVTQTLQVLIARMRELSNSIVKEAAKSSQHNKDCTAAIVAAHAFESWAATAQQECSSLQLDAALAPILQLEMRSYKKTDDEQAIKEAASTLRDLGHNIKDLREFEDFLPVYNDIIDRLDEFALICAQAKRAADVMDYKDLGICAVETLKRRKDLRQEWKNGIDSILIDEFQDNNDLQRDLLFLLAERTDVVNEGIPKKQSLAQDKLFFVGDEKQSIYRFRGADVSVFKRLAQDLDDSVQEDSASLAGEPVSHNLTIATNYRSSSRLIDFFNSFFSYALPVHFEQKTKSKKKQHAQDLIEYLFQKENLSDYFAHYVAMHPPKPEPVLDNEQGSTDTGAQADNIPESQITYYYLNTPQDSDDESDGDSDDGNDAGDTTLAESDDPTPADDNLSAKRDELLDADDNLALEIARFIRNSVGKLAVRGSDGLARYEDFAILLRATTNQSKLEKYLRLLDIPFESQSQRSLFEESAAKDLYYLLRLFEDPADKFAFAAVLRSPLCRISDEGFLTLMTAYDEDCKRATAEDLFEQTFDLANYDKQVLQRASSFYKALSQKVTICSVAEVALYAWHFSGIRLDIASRSESSFYLEQFDHLFEIAANIDDKGGDLSDFLAALRPFIEGKRGDFESSAVQRHRQHGVQIMTIHKAKGLEFPIVIIPWVESAGLNSRTTKLWHMLPEGLTIDIKPYDMPDAKSHNVFFDINRELELQKEEAEIRRLLYVACTRAKDHLFFFGKRMKNEPTSRAFMAYLEGYCEQQTTEQIKKVYLEPSAIGDVGKVQKHKQGAVVGDFLAAYKKSSIVSVPQGRIRTSAVALNAAASAQASGGAQMQGEAQMLGGPQPLGGAQATNGWQGSAAAQMAAAGRMPFDVPIPPDRFGTLCHDAVEWGILHQLQAEQIGEIEASLVRPSAETVLEKGAGEQGVGPDGWRAGEQGAGPDGLSSGPGKSGAGFEPGPGELGSGSDFWSEFAPSRAVAKGLESEPLARALALAIQLAQGFLGSEYWKQARALGCACTIKTEKPFLLKVDDMVVEGRMDLFVEKTDAIDIIDFKSDAVQDSARYAVQLELYRRAAQKFAPGKPVRLGIFWLRTAELAWLQSEIGDALLAAALREIRGEAAVGGV